MENNQLFDNKQKWLDLTKLQQKKLIYSEIISERIKQDEKWGIQNHLIVDDSYVPEGMHLRYGLPSEKRVKELCDSLSKKNELTWGDIIVEELVEALNAPNKESMREELIQCAAVIVAMIESLDRNGK